MKARFHGRAFYDASIKKWLFTLETYEQPDEKLIDKDLDVQLKLLRQKRSLNANAYFHVLVDKIAAELGVSHSEVHNQVIAEYGYRDNDAEGVLLKEEIDWTKIDSIHLRPTTRWVFHDGEPYRLYDVMRGSHTYDTKEMARLIDGVVYEAKSIGIETLSPDELERMKSLWKVS